MKKIISALLIVMCLSVSLIIPASAQTAEKLGLKTARNENSVSVTVSTSQARCGLQAVIGFESEKLTFSGAEILNSDLKTYNTVNDSVKLNGNTVRIMLTGNSDIGGDWIVLNFTVKDGATGTASFTASDVKTVGADKQSYNGSADAVSITLTVLKGDVNGDGSVNIIDLVRMKKYLAQITSEIVTDNADMDSDGAVENEDMVLLRKTLIGL